MENLCPSELGGDKRHDFIKELRSPGTAEYENILLFRLSVLKSFSKLMPNRMPSSHYVASGSALAVARKVLVTTFASFANI